MVRITSISSISLVQRSALLSLSKDARVPRFSKDEGRPQARSCQRPSFETRPSGAPQDEVRGLEFDRSIRLVSWNRSTRSLSEYSQIAEPRGIEFSSVFASIPAMESSTLDGGFLGIEFSSESMIANTRTGS